MHTQYGTSQPSRFVTSGIGMLTDIVMRRSAAVFSISNETGYILTKGSDMRFLNRILQY